MGGGETGRRGDGNTVRLIDSLVRIAPCLVSLNLEGTSRARAAKSPNSGGLLSILLPQNWGLGLIRTVLGEMGDNDTMQVLGYT